MDESWRMSMGLGLSSTTDQQYFPHRKSMENSVFSTNHVSMVMADHDDNIDADDYSDVFGGPPRSVLGRKLSRDFTQYSTTSSFYEEVFRPPDDQFNSSRSMKGSGRSLPAFRSPSSGEGFYSDIFGFDDDLRRRSNSKDKSKSNSSINSVLSSEELSPLRQVAGDDVGYGLSSFSSKLR